MRSMRSGSQLTPQNFANIGFGQLITELNVLGPFVTREVVMAVFGHGIFGQHAVVANHKHFDGLALHGVWYANGGALNNARAQ